MATQVLLLNGASSAGKTSLALAIQALLPEPWLTLGIDTLIGAMPLKLLGTPDGLTIHADGQITVGPGWRALEDDWRRALGAMARAGVRLVIDEVMLGGATGQASWNEALAGLGVLWVAVRCEPAELARREAARGDRVAGMSALQVPVVHAGVAYDLELDTTRLGADECARQVVDRLN
jgi:chloramphenicol 3-O phosphotransferase